ncbi:neurturin [Gracilinanus agilis]|uniref:neurturin n=1 Tax=Gracilinanus agilis TaxID=191870 RepID=UPI001CFD84C5|nr:neurturin [Gracilinanus agilis]
MSPAGVACLSRFPPPAMMFATSLGGDPHPLAKPSHLFTQTEGVGRRAASPERDRALFESYTEGEIRELISALVERSSPSGHSGGHALPFSGQAGARRKRARVRHQPCGLRELEVSVSELGLGYVSDETILFRYCSGTCEAAARIYDLGLRRLRQRRRVRKEKIRARPCCRPLAYEEEVSFLDSRNRYHTVSELSAKECGCV